MWMAVEYHTVIQKPDLRTKYCGCMGESRNLKYSKDYLVLYNK